MRNILVTHNFIKHQTAWSLTHKKDRISQYKATRTSKQMLVIDNKAVISQFENCLPSKDYIKNK